MRITVVDVPDRARFELRIDDELVGWATYHVSDGAVTLPLTEVDPTQHGRGFGTILVRGVLTSLRQRRLRVLPYCAFVRHYLLAHPDELDLVSVADRPRFGLPPLLQPQTENCGETLPDRADLDPRRGQRERHRHDASPSADDAVPAPYRMPRGRRDDVAESSAGLDRRLGSPAWTAGGLRLLLVAAEQDVEAGDRAVPDQLAGPTAVPDEEHHGEQAVDRGQHHDHHGVRRARKQDAAEELDREQGQQGDRAAPPPDWGPPLPLGRG